MTFSPPSDSSPPADEDPVQIPPRLAWRVRILQARSLLSDHAVWVGFVVGVAASAMIGLILIGVSLSSGSGGGLGCLIAVEAPLIGIFCAIGFACASILWQTLVRTLMYYADPKEREAVRTLQQIEEGKWPGEADNEPPADAPPGAAVEDRVVAPGEAVDDRISETSPAHVRRGDRES